MTDAPTLQHWKQQLAEGEASGDVARQIASLNALAWALCDTDMKAAYAFSEEACALASVPPNGALPDRAGIGYSLRTQGYVNMRLGDYALGLTQLLKAQDLLEPLQLFDGLADVYDGMAGIYEQIGDNTEAFRCIQQQVEAAQRTGDLHLIANATNNQAIAFRLTGEDERAIELQQRNLELALQIGYPRVEFLSCINLVSLYLETGLHEQALDLAQRALHISQEAEFEIFEVYALEYVGNAYLKLGDSAQAIRFLERAVAMAQSLNAKVNEAVALFDIGEAYRTLQQYQRAVFYLQKSIEVGQTVDDKGNLIQAHWRISEIYELLGEHALALAHLKQHYSLKEVVTGEKADQRLRVLQVQYETATARKEAELLQLKTQKLEQEISEQKLVEQALQAARDDLDEKVRMRTYELSNTISLLQKEVADRERAEAEIQRMVQTLEQRVADRTEELAAFFDLVLLSGQPTSLTDIVEQALPRIIEVTRSQAVGIHLLDEDRSTLRLEAQLNLSDEDQARLQTVPLDPDFQQWLAQPNDPLVTMCLSGLSVLPPAFCLSEFQSYLGAQIKIGQRIEGIISYFRFSAQGFGVDEVALGTALAELTGMVLETHELREHAEAMAVVEERQRLARDLHDSVTQSLYSLSLFSHSAREAAADGDADRLNTSLLALEQNTLHALREMRLLLYELRPADLEQEGLRKAIELRLNAVERRANLKLDVQLDEITGLSFQQEVELYHIVVEALNNVVKHSAAARLTLHLTQTAENLHLQLTDDGQGFDPAQTRGGMGLTNIRERVARLGGQLTISSDPQSGTRLEAVIPYRLEEDDD